MRRTILSVAVLAATLLLPLAAHTPLAQGIARPAVVGPAFARVIVKYRADSDLLKKQALTATGTRTLQAHALGDRIGVALTAGIGLSDRSHVVMAHGLSSESLAARIAAQKDVEFAVVDERKHIVAVPNDPFYASRAATASAGGPTVGQWYLKPPGPDGTAANTAPAAINAEQAWDITTGSASVVVAVLDTGVRKDHPDIAGVNLLPGYDMISADSPGVFATANDGDDRDADASDPGDWITVAEANQSGGIFFQCGARDSGGNYIGESSSWHGTQTLGLIGAATNNGAGIASVGRNVKVLPVRVLGKCGGSDSDIVVAMQWAAGVYSASELAMLGLPANPTPAKVLSMSLGGTSGNACPQLYIDAMTRITAAGAVVVASAGNSAGHLVGTPANCPGVIAVTGLRHVGDKVGFSDLGPEVTISAPGGNCVNTGNSQPCLYPIMTTANSGTTNPVLGAAGAIYTDSFNPSLGTSFSAPLVSGTVALMLSVKPSLTPAQVKAALQSSARAFPTTGGTTSPATPQCFAPTATSMDQGECYCIVGVCGAGMLDAHAAVLRAAGVQAAISVTTAAPTAGQPISIASSSVIGAGQSVASYQWSIVSAGTTGAAISGSSTGSTVTVSAPAAGVFTISLATIDNNGFGSTANSIITVAAPVQAAITVTTAAPTAGQPVAIVSSSVIGAGQSATYQWAIVTAGSTGAVISGSSTSAAVTVLPSAAGSFTIRLTTTDNNFVVSTANSVVTVAAAATSSGGGGGALDATWLLLLLGAVLALAAAARFERRRAALSAPDRALRRR